MALAHARPLQPVDIHPLRDALSHSATHAILKTPSTELIRVILRAGGGQPAHRVAGDMTLLCLEGVVEVRLDGPPCRLEAMQLVLVPGGVERAIAAVTDASLLMTIHVPAGMPGSGSSTNG